MANDMFRDGVEPATSAVELLAQLAATTRAVTAASASDPFEQVVAAIIGDAARAVGADRAALWLEREDGLEVIATTGLQAMTIDRFQRFDVPAETPAKSALRHGTPIVWTTHTAAERYFPHIAAQNFGSGFVSPLHIKGQYAGVLFVGWATEQRPVHAIERSFLEAIAHTCASAVNTSEPHRDGNDVSRHDGIAAIGEAFAITLTTSDIATIAWITGEIDISNLDEFRHCLQHITDNNTRKRIVLDLTDVEFLSVAAARLVLTLTEQPANPHTAIELRNAPANVRRVFDVISTN